MKFDETKFSITKPTLSDIPAMRTLILPEVQRGIILDRTEDEMATSIRSYSVVRANFGVDSGKIIAFSALHIHSMNLAEVRSLIVGESYRRLGIATALILRLIKEGESLNLKEILTLTYQKEVFSKIGFKEIAKDSLPNQKIWADCVKCKKFPICDEIALLKTL